jgi:poly-beta-1,6-N-acetyl-D-glucosamine synthase
MSLAPAPGFPFTPGGTGARGGLIAGGVVAHNDEARVERSVRSLLSQELPIGIRWSQIWLVASGCTDRTVEIARGIAEEDERVQLVVEPERRGKAAALQQVLSRAEGDALVLLNSDAVAYPGAVAALLERGRGKRAPFAVMGRPVLSPQSEGSWSETLAWMWDLHHEYHLELLENGQGTHLCDELLLLGGPEFPPVPTGVINDGSYLAVWLDRNGGSCWYAPDARVEIDVPRTRLDHLRQRRRVHVGNAQVTSMLGEPPATLPRYFWRHPVSTARRLGKLIDRPGGARSFLRIAAGEVAAHALALWDRFPPAKDHVRWSRIAPGGPASPGPTAAAVPVAREPRAYVDQRVRALVGAASRFDAGIPVREFLQLLPKDGPATSAELSEWLTSHPETARIEQDMVLPTSGRLDDLPARRRRAEEFEAFAQRLISRELGPLRTIVRTAAVSGSTAYGAPEDGDDLDLFVVTRTGALWFFLAAAYLRLRFRPREDRGPDVPRVCLNFVLDEASASREMSVRQGLLIAREALTARPVVGAGYYAQLLGTASWMAEELPRLYRQRASDEPLARAAPAALGVRLLNTLLFPVVATYLQIAGILRNRELARQRRPEDQFVTLTQLHELSFRSQQFEWLRAAHEASPDTAASGPAPSGPGATGPAGSRRYSRRALTDAR